MQKYYQNKVDQYQQSIQLIESNIKRLAGAKLLSFVLMMASFGFTGKQEVFYSLLIGGVLGLSFLLNHERKLNKNKKTLKQRILINSNELNAQERKSNIYPNGEVFLDQQHRYSYDLDFFGKHSIYAFLNRAATFYGVKTLADWLNTKTNKEEVLNRQKLGQEIANDPEWMEQFQLNILTVPKDNMEQSMEDWLSQKIELKNKNTHRLFSVLSPLVMIVSLVGGMVFNWGMPAFIVSCVLFLTHLIYTVQFKAAAKHLLINTAYRAQELAVYYEAFQTVEKKEWQSEKGKQLQESLKHEGEFISQKINQLFKIVKAISVGENAIAGIMVNSMLLWEVRYTFKLEKWINKQQADLANSFTVIGELEAVLSFARLKYNFSEWTYPELVDERAVLEVESVGHPLIAESKRVSNSYQNKQSGQVDVITGSNMSGKSTFLRAVGVNMVLALAGAPVAAKSFKTSVFSLFTSMKITDSVNEGISTFAMEIKRLKLILDYVEVNEDAFLLLDEILRGTNSKDKLKGSIAVVKKIIGSNNQGVFATHNIELAELEEKEKVKNYYFDIKIEDGEMYFDYKLNRGVCNTFNASLLLEKIGVYS